MKLVTKIFIAIDVLITGCFFLVYGPFDWARVFWITTSMETLSHRYLADIFYSKETITEVMNNNYLIVLEEETNVNDITIGEVETKENYESIYEKQILERDKDALYKLITFKYKEFDCYLIAVYDSKRISVATSTNLRYSDGETLLDIAKKNDAIAAINGGGYLWSNGKASGIVVHDGKLIHAESKARYVSAAFNSEGVLMVGSMSASDIESKDIKEAVSFGPALIVNGKSVTIKGTGGTGLNPRTAIAQRKDGIVLFLVVNGYGKGLSWKGRGGVYINDVLTILERYKAYNAINMDGGSSTTMVMDGKLVNTPCEPVKDGADFITTSWILK